MCCIKNLFLKAKENITSDCKTYKDSEYFSSKKCSDQYVGIISICESCEKVKWINNDFTCKDKVYREKLSKNLQKKDIKTILLVLESPHKDEYNKKSEYIGPANGSTGKNIENYLDKLIEKFNSEKTINSFDSGVYKVYLANAIQYQCSLGAPTNKYRDMVFEYMWKTSLVRNNLIKRIKTINPKYIIVCCTKGIRKNREEDTLRYKVQTIVKKKLNKKILYKSTHPFSWKKYRKIDIL